LTEGVGPYVHGTQGPVHAGTGDMYVQFSPLVDAKGRNPRAQAEDELRWLEERFVHPRRFATARETLAAHRTVLLEGRLGSGRATAARMLLWELRRDTEQFHGLSLQEDADSRQILDLDHVGDGDRIWLDLSQVAGAPWEKAHSELSTLRRAVRTHNAHLVIVLPDNLSDLHPELDPFRVRITRPPLPEVLHRHLLMAEFPRPTPFPSLQFLEADPALKEVPKYVRLVQEARDKADGDTDFTSWCAMAYEAWAGQEQEVDKLIHDLPNGGQRALLLSTAMLHGAHADSVLSAGASLLQALEHPSTPCPALEQVPLGQRLHEIEAELNDSGRVRFKKLGFDSAVREYFWVHLPELREGMPTWVDRTADSSVLNKAEWEDLVTRFTEQCLNDRDLPMLLSLVEKWTSRSPNSHRVHAATLLLQRGLQHEQHGRAFRGQIYWWSRKDRLPAPLVDLLVVACRDQMAVSHPDEALVRLHHLARRGNGTPDRARAREALLQLAREDRRFFRQLLNRLSDKSPERRFWRADPELFLDLADPALVSDSESSHHALISEHTVRAHLVIGWSIVFTECPHAIWSAKAQQWLYRAAIDEMQRETLLDVLVEAGEQRTSVLARLYAITRERDIRPVIGDQILQKIDAAQGVEFV
jgi:hypothetical protein